MPGFNVPADRPFRAPPSSQPVIPSRASSAFPSLQRPRPLPPTFTQSQRRPVPSSSQQQQSQRPTLNHLDNRYSPPSSQHSQIFTQVPQSQSKGQRQVSRPSSSLGDHLLENVDQYRPGSVGPRTAAEVYQSNHSGLGVPPKAQKGAEILEKIAGLQKYIEEKFTKREEDDEEFQGCLEDRLKGLEDENKDLKERLHELSMGQKILPTKEELNEEITNQLSPALHEFFDQLGETLKKGLEPLPDKTAELAARKVKGDMLEMQDLAKKEALKEGAIENPLMTLLNHLITKLTPLDDITKTLDSLSDLPEALEQVAVFKQTMEVMQTRIANRADPDPYTPKRGPTATPPPVDISAYTSQITQVLEAVDSIRKKVEVPPTPPVRLDSGKVFGAITGLKRILEDLKASIDSGAGQEPVVENDDVKEARDRGLKEMKDMMREMKEEMAMLKETVARPAPTTITTTGTDPETTATLQAILEQLKERPVPVTHLPTPSTGIRAPLAEIHDTQHATQMIREEPDTRILGRPVRPTVKARQDPATMRTLGRRDIQSAAANGPEADDAGPSDIFGTIQPIPNAEGNVPNKKRKTKTTAVKATLGSTLAISEQPGDQDTSHGTSSRNTSTGSVANKGGRKRKTPPDDSLPVKQERVRGFTMDRPMTRSDSTKAKSLGIDIIDLASSSEGSGKGKIAGTRKGSTGSSSKGKGRVSQPVSTTTTHPVSQHRSDTQPSASAHDDRLESLPLPDSQIPESQLPETRPEPTQLNNSHTDSIFEFGHGQLPSVPSLPAYTYDSTDGYTDTYIAPQVEKDDKDDKDEASTSTEQVEESLMIPKAETPRRAEPAYRRYQKRGQGSGQGPKTYGCHVKLNGMVKGNFGILESSDEE